MNSATFLHLFALSLYYQYVCYSSLVRYNNKTYRIDDIDWESTPQSTFKLFSGQEITFMDYYKKVSLQTQVCKVS